MSLRMSHPIGQRSVRLRLTGATTLRDGRMQQRSVAIEGGLVTKGPLPEVDLSGYYVLPGIVDLHSTALERLRASLPLPSEGDTLLAAAEREAAAHGVTTAWLGQRWGREGGAAGPADARHMLSRHAAYVGCRAIVDMRLSLVCDPLAVESRDALLAAILRHRVGLVHFAGATVVFDDLSESDAQTGEIAREVPRHLCRLAEGFDTLGVVYGSLDDSDGETRETFSMIGAKLCTRPARRSAAALARAVGDPVLLPASSILDGATGPRDATATDLIRAGLCTALVSDGSPTSLAEAAFALSRSGLLSLPRAWATVSSIPAAIARLPDRGLIDYGRRADLVIVNAESHAVEGTIAAGRIAHLSGGAAERFLSSRSDIAFAAE